MIQFNKTSLTFDKDYTFIFPQVMHNVEKGEREVKTYLGLFTDLDFSGTVKLSVSESVSTSCEISKETSW